MSNLPPRDALSDALPTPDTPLNLLTSTPAPLPNPTAHDDRQLKELAAVLELVLKAPQRCQLSSFYIQAVITPWAKFLTTNLASRPITDLTPIASSWLIGRSPTAAISIQHNTISRQHAIIGHDGMDGFYMIDLGSSNGTWVNHRRLAPTERQILRNGDMLQLGRLKVEFFADSSPESYKHSVETTYH